VRYTEVHSHHHHHHSSISSSYQEEEREDEREGRSTIHDGSRSTSSKVNKTTKDDVSSLAVISPLSGAEVSTSVSSLKDTISTHTSYSLNLNEEEEEEDEEEEEGELTKSKSSSPRIKKKEKRSSHSNRFKTPLLSHEKEVTVCSGGGGGGGLNGDDSVASSNIQLDVEVRRDVNHSVAEGDHNRDCNQTPSVSTASTWKPKCRSPLDLYYDIYRATSYISNSYHTCFSRANNEVTPPSPSSSSSSSFSNMHPNSGSENKTKKKIQSKQQKDGGSCNGSSSGVNRNGFESLNNDAVFDHEEHDTVMNHHNNDKTSSFKIRRSKGEKNDDDDDDNDDVEEGQKKEDAEAHVRHIVDEEEEYREERDEEEEATEVTEKSGFDMSLVEILHDFRFQMFVLTFSFVAAFTEVKLCE
jgi:hypothetical protein